MLDCKQVDGDSAFRRLEAVFDDLMPVPLQEQFGRQDIFYAPHAHRVTDEHVSLQARRSADALRIGRKRADAVVAITRIGFTQLR